MNVLVLNCGSSSVKFQLVETDETKIKDHSDVIKAKGLIERIGSQSLVTLQSLKNNVQKDSMPFRTHKKAIEFISQWLISDESHIPDIKEFKDIHAIGHRVVHGGEKFTDSVLINKEVIKGIEDCIDLAPLHNPANLSGIQAITEVFGNDIPQVAVFDTSFHSTMPESAFLYALPYQYYRRYKVRRYGFHGTSHRYIAYRYGQLTGLPDEKINIITLHLGNGCSACAIKKGKSVNTSMGMTPLEGLVMGTRSGDFDPAILQYLAEKEGLSLEYLDNMLNKQSGLLGVSGLTNDMRELIEEKRENSDRRVSLAIELFCKRVQRYIGAYLAELNGTDAIIFTGGIGENSHPVRQRICENLDQLGIDIDPEINPTIIKGKEGEISPSTSKIKLMVIPTNEELLIARDTFRCVH